MYIYIRKCPALPLTFSVCITQSLLPHVTQSYRSFTTAVNELVALNRVKDCGSDHFCKFLHVGWLDINNVLLGGRKKSVKVKLTFLKMEFFFYSFSNIFFDCQTILCYSLLALLKHVEEYSIGNANHRQNSLGKGSLKEETLPSQFKIT